MSLGSNVIDFVPASSGKQGRTYLDRQELQAILNVYGRFVSSGDWRDYALDFEKGFASFSIFRRASEAPLYQIIKEPALAQKQGAWRIVGMNGQVLKRGKKLQTLLGYFD